MRSRKIWAAAAIWVAGAAQAEVYRCDKDGRPVYTSVAGPGCVPVEVNAPQPSAEEVQRETAKWSRRMEQDRMQQEEAAKAREEQAQQARDAQLQDLQRQFERQRQLAQQRNRPPPPPSDSTLEEP